MKTKSIYDVVMDVENGSDDGYADIQRMINKGIWGLQGSFGRTMMAAIEAGECLLGPKPARDYYGNRIPSRDEVQPGTKGSYEFVVEQSGKEHADLMLAVQ